MKLFKILDGVDILKNNCSNMNMEISNIAYNSAKVSGESMFVCLNGANNDGHFFAKDAINKGCVVIIAERELEVSFENVVIVKNARKELAKMSCNFFDNPASKLITVGITGTKGKTTTSYMIKSILEQNGDKAGVIGTIGVLLHNKVIKTENTTPESYEIQSYLSYMVEKGYKYAVLEASSLGLKHHRLGGFKFNYSIFTNFSKDHIGSNEHENMEDYFNSKCLLFKNSEVGFVNNDDDKYLDILKSSTCSIKTFGFDSSSDLCCRSDDLMVNQGYVGVECKFKSSRCAYDLKIPVPGRFNVYNALAACLFCEYEGIDVGIIREGISKVKVKGRVEPVKVSGNYTFLIDYAHNAVSMKNILITLREYNPNRLIVLFGAGGNRPRDRRFEMGEVAGKLADLSVITEDNSRFENTADIIKDIEVGMQKVNGKYTVIPNRKKAIKYCIENAKDGDIIVLAGKGHETYQEINGVKYNFDEREIINNIL
ncbi:MAG: UDP-N-acetylmuramoyl-L-alanyl-D-glutamate--2,6-diaminopimelate ligase [Oscillospiraceae bacterium]|jgi:UDP-N-acetylmuramoyl-L-alanyl-D-glutamate--2,6-diaminopimelate ligase|nr:UDP-N-acetylmuramoyl-L-alanyl-D-glutamate--2,6-diaminopimelate ligase [Oscillospiraceae bacterium]